MDCHHGHAIPSCLKISDRRSSEPASVAFISYCAPGPRLHTLLEAQEGESWGVTWKTDTATLRLRDMAAREGATCSAVTTTALLITASSALSGPFWPLRALHPWCGHHTLFSLQDRDQTTHKTGRPANRTACSRGSSASRLEAVRYISEPPRSGRQAKFLRVPGGGFGSSRSAYVRRPGCADPP